MAFGLDDNRDARLELLLDAAHLYLLDHDEASAILDHQVATIQSEWDEACDAAMLTALERERF